MKLSIVFVFIVGCSCINAKRYQTQEELNRDNAKDAVEDSLKTYTGGAVKLADHFVKAADQRKQEEELRRTLSPANFEQWKRKEDMKRWEDAQKGLDKIFSFVGDTVSTAVRTSNVHDTRQRNFDLPNF